METLRPAIHPQLFESGAKGSLASALIGIVLGPVRDIDDRRYFAGWLRAGGKRIGRSNQRCDELPPSHPRTLAMIAATLSRSAPHWNLRMALLCRFSDAGR